jgi:hypothetical protein
MCHQNDNHNNFSSQEEFEQFKLNNAGIETLRTFSQYPCLTKNCNGHGSKMSLPKGHGILHFHVPCYKCYDNNN